MEGNSGTSALARTGGEWFSGSVGVGPDQLPTSLADAVASDVAGWQTTRIDGAATMAVGVPLPA